MCVLKPISQNCRTFHGTLQNYGLFRRLYSPRNFKIPGLLRVCTNHRMNMTGRQRNYRFPN